MPSNLSSLASNLQLVTGPDQGLKASPPESTMKAQLAPNIQISTNIQNAAALYLSSMFPVEQTNVKFYSLM